MSIRAIRGRPCPRLASGFLTLGCPRIRSSFSPRERTNRPMTHAEPLEPLILGIESSCDETATSLVTREGRVRANGVASQVDLHARFGGVVPEVAARMHIEACLPLVQQVMDEAGAGWDRIEAIGATPGAGPDRLPAGGDRDGQGAGLAAAQAAHRRQSPRGPSLRDQPGAPARGAPPDRARRRGGRPAAGARARPRRN